MLGRNLPLVVAVASSSGVKADCGFDGFCSTFFATGEPSGDDLPFKARLEFAAWLVSPYIVGEGLPGGAGPPLTGRPAALGFPGGGRDRLGCFAGTAAP